MNVVDSSGWLEYFAGGPNASYFGMPIEKAGTLLVPVICIYEVFKHFLIHRNEQDGLKAITLMQQGIVLELTPEGALESARTSFLLKFPMADSIILSMARKHHAKLWTQDADFKGLPDVNYRAKP